MEQHNEETLQKLAKKRLDLEKLKDKHVLLHPEISKWRSREKPDIQMLRSLNNNGQIVGEGIRTKYSRWQPFGYLMTPPCP